MGRSRWIRLLLAGLGLVMATLPLARRGRAEAVEHPVYYIATREKAMALTFDVSWGQVMLPKVIAVLRAEKQPATFFLSGPWARDHPALVEELVRDGFEIASHGQAHVNLSGLSSERIADNIGKADTILTGFTNRPLRFFRPPNGDWDPRVVQTALGLGYQTVIWSVDSRDWMNPGVGAIARRVVSQAFPGAIILLHASDTCKQTDLALPLIIQRLRAEGYRLVTLGSLWAMGQARRDDPRGSGVKPHTGPTGVLTQASSVAACWWRTVYGGWGPASVGVTAARRHCPPRGGYQRSIGPGPSSPRRLVRDQASPGAPAREPSPL